MKWSSLILAPDDAVGGHSAREYIKRRHIMSYFICCARKRFFKKILHVNIIWPNNAIFGPKLFISKNRRPPLKF